MMTGSEASRAMHEVRARDPSFDQIRFLRSVKLDAPTVVKAFLKVGAAVQQYTVPQHMAGRYGVAVLVGGGTRAACVGAHERRRGGGQASCQTAWQWQA